MIEIAQSQLQIWLRTLPLTTTARAQRKLTPSQKVRAWAATTWEIAADEADDVRGEGETDESSVPENIVNDSEPALPRRSTRGRKPPDRYGFNVASI